MQSHIIVDQFPFNYDKLIAMPVAGLVFLASIVGSFGFDVTPGAPTVTVPHQAAVAVQREPPANQTAAVKDSPPPAQSDESAPPGKPSSLIHMLEGREDDLVLWLGIAVTFFVIGWICGGNYYLQRDRKRRGKLRF